MAKWTYIVLMAMVNVQYGSISITDFDSGNTVWQTQEEVFNSPDGKEIFVRGHYPSYVTERDTLQTETIRLLLEGRPEEAAYDCTVRYYRVLRQGCYS